MYVLYSRLTGLWSLCTLHLAFPLWGLCHPFLPLPALLIFPEASQMPLLLFSLLCFAATFKPLTAINALKMHPLITLHKHLFIPSFLDLTFFLRSHQLINTQIWEEGNARLFKKEPRSNHDGIYTIWENLVKLPINLSGLYWGLDRRHVWWLAQYLAKRIMF